MRTRTRRVATSSWVLACLVAVATSLVASRAGASVPPVQRASATGVPVWSPPQRLDPGAGFSSVSCPTTRFCMVVDELGDAMSWHGSRWSAPVAVDPHLGPLHAVSCPTATSCTAVDQAGRVLRWNGKSWSKPVLVDAHGLEDLTCPSTRFCAAADFDGNVLTWNGSRWSAPVAIEQGGEGFSTLTCPSTRFCAAMTPDGFFASWNGRSWSKPIDESPGGASISALFDCVSSTFCVVSFSNGEAAVDRGSGSLRPVLVDRSGTGFSSLSCPTKTFCMGVDRHGSAFTWNGTRWSAPVKADPDPGQLGLTSVSCPAPSRCVAVDSNGDVVVARP
jgi:hypothetical protein